MKPAWDVRKAAGLGVTVGGLASIIWSLSIKPYVFGQTIGSMVVGGALFAAVAAIRNRLAK